MNFKRFISILLICICLFTTISTTYADTDNIDKYTEDCYKQGKFETVELEIETGWLSGEYLSSTMNIYTPYNYNMHTKYNCIVLLCDNYILEQSRNQIINLYDWLIYDNITKPFIIVEIPIPTKYDEATYRLFAYNIRNHYLPYISDNYSVYATGSGLNGWIEGRDYTGVIGIKNGSSFAYQSCMVWNRDIFGSYYFGDPGERLNAKSISNYINTDELYTINVLNFDDYTGSSTLNNSNNMYKIFKKRCKTLNVNQFILDKRDIILTLYTAIPTLFKNDVNNKIYIAAKNLLNSSKHTHIYKDNKCIICGRNPIFWQDDLPRRYYTKCPHQGKVVEVDYTTKNYWYEKSEEYTKHMLVYLPYDYDETKQYDVLILLHGHTLDRTAIMNKITTFNYGVKSTFRDMFDWVFYDKLTPSKIIVTLDTPLESDHKFRDMMYEIRYDVLPTIANNFATYAKDGSEESLIAARDHFGCGGSSNGAGYTHGGALYANMDMFGSIILMSGGMNQVRQANDILKYENYKLNCFVRAGGTEDPLYPEIVNGFNYVIKKVDYLEENKNAYLFEVTAGHNGRVSYTSLVSALQILFQPMNLESEKEIG